MHETKNEGLELGTWLRKWKGTAWKEKNTNFIGYHFFSFWGCKTPVKSGMIYQKQEIAVVSPQFSHQQKNHFKWHTCKWKVDKTGDGRCSETRWYYSWSKEFHFVLLVWGTWELTQRILVLHPKSQHFLISKQKHPPRLAVMLCVFNKSQLVFCLFFALDFRPNAAQPHRCCFRRAKFCLNRNWFALPAPGHESLLVGDSTE